MPKYRTWSAHLVSVTLESEVTPPPPEQNLLNGPRLPAAAMDQSDIDRLLASFD